MYEREHIVRHKRLGQEGKIEYISIDPDTDEIRFLTVRLTKQSRGMTGRLNQAQRRGTGRQTHKVNVRCWSTGEVVLVRKGVMNT